MYRYQSNKTICKKTSASKSARTVLPRPRVEKKEKDQLTPTENTGGTRPSQAYRGPPRDKPTATAMSLTATGDTHCTVRGAAGASYVNCPVSSRPGAAVKPERDRPVTTAHQQCAGSADGRHQ